MTDARPIRQLLYVSRATAPLSEAACQVLLASSRAHNETNDVTGMLVYLSDGTFMQVIEGDPASIDETMARIEADPRHHDVKRIFDNRVPARAFADWSMGFRQMDAEAFARFAARGLVTAPIDLERPLVGGPIMEAMVRMMNQANMPPPGR